MQVGVLVAGGLAGARIARHRAVLCTTSPGAARRAVLSAATLVSVLLAAGVLAVTAA